MNNFFITGINTGTGKTVASAIITEALQADYWKPIQAGSLEDSDTYTVKQLISNPVSVLHPEAYRLTHAMSPHAAAAKDNITINLNKISLPETNNRLIIEGAGGIMVPLNNKIMITDLIIHLKASVILISQNYLGSINHTLLSVEALLKRNIPVSGIIFNGEQAPETEKYILQYTGLQKIGSISQEKILNKNVIRQYAEIFKPALKQIT